MATKKGSKKVGGGSKSTGSITGPREKDWPKSRGGKVSGGKASTGSITGAKGKTSSKKK